MRSAPRTPSPWGASDRRRRPGRRRRHVARAPAQPAPLPSADRDEHASVSVVVADDNERFREGLVRSIATDPEVRVVGQAGDGATALEVLVRTRPDVAVVDARMPVLGGIELARAVAQVPALERTQVVLLGATLDRRVTSQADDSRRRPVPGQGPLPPRHP